MTMTDAELDALLENLESLTGIRVTQRIENLKKQNAELLEALEAVEWTKLDWGGNKVCPWCGNGKIQGHHIDCKRQRAIAKAEGKEND